MAFNREEIELMSPVGSYESLTAAIQAGAGSVYFGTGHLNMRSRSSNNFTIEDIPEIVSISDKNEVKPYLAVNTVIYDGEIDLMKSTIDAAKEHGITAVIATDHAAIAYANSIGMEVHISTQVNVSNIESVKFYSRYADVIVTARELNIEQVSKITSEIEEQEILGPSGKPVRIEIFVHGALCMSISGKCYLSLHEKNYSANRGECLQPCRRKYPVVTAYSDSSTYTAKEEESGIELEIDNEYIMSPKDLCTIGFLDKIIEAGVKVLKIEGRGRSPEYVKCVTECYKKAIDSYFDSTYSDEKINAWMKRLSTVYNRGFWDGYYLRQKLGEWSNKYGSQATKKKIYIAKATNYYSKINVASFKLENDDLKIGDDILIIGPTTGVIEMNLKEMMVDYTNVEIAGKGDEISFPIEEIIRRSDRLYKLVDAAP